jgi:hypothetical protein
MYFLTRPGIEAIDALGTPSPSHPDHPLHQRAVAFSLWRSVMMTTRRRWSTALLVVLMTVLSADRLAAQQASPPDDVGQWNVTPFVGFGFSGDLDSATGAVGVAGGYNWSPTVSLEGELNILPSSESGGLVEVNSKAWSLTANLLYHFAPRTFRPYGVFGVGFGHASLDVSPSAPGLGALDSSSTEFVVNFGGGVERAIRHNIHFRGDLRYFFGSDLVPDYWRVGAGLKFGLGGR